MIRKFLFDVDGTLTPSRDKIDENFSHWLLDFFTRNDCYIITGSDYEKTVEQIGDELCRAAVKCYNCAGNSVWVKGENVYNREIGVPEKLQTLFDMFLDESAFPIRTGGHIEVRPGLINFSVLGRNATREQRAEYVQWDKNTGERELMAQMISESDFFYDVRVAGETGLDIVEYGFGKEQIIKDFDTDSHHIHFFGDKMEEGGNDYELARKVKESGNRAFNVLEWRETWAYLKDLS